MIGLPFGFGTGFVLGPAFCPLGVVALIFEAFVDGVLCFFGFIFSIGAEVLDGILGIDTCFLGLPTQLARGIVETVLNFVRQGVPSIRGSGVQGFDRRLGDLRERFRWRKLGRGHARVHRGLTAFFGTAHTLSQAFQ